MAQQFFIKRRRSGAFDLFTRELIPASEINARIQHMVNDLGWTQFEAEREIELMITGFNRRNETATTYGMCAKFTFETAQPGDVIVMGAKNAVFVVNRPALA